MEKTLLKVTLNIIQEKHDEQKRKGLVKDFKTEARKEIKAGARNVSTITLTNGKYLIESLVQENLTDCVEILVNEIVKRAQLDADDELKRLRLFGEFQVILSKVPKDIINTLKFPDGDTLLQSLCDFQLLEFVELLFKNDPELDPNSASQDNHNQPILISAYRGDSRTMKLLLNQNANISHAIYNENQTNETILHLILRSGNSTSLEKESANHCLQLLLNPSSSFKDFQLSNRIKQEISQIVNHKDKFENTALKYATQMWSNSIVLQLLKHGATIGDLVTKISPVTIKEFFDDHCIQSNYNEKDANEQSNLVQIGTDDTQCIHIGQPQLEITFDYSFLEAASNVEPAGNERDSECCPLSRSNSSKDIFYETKVLRDMARSKDHRHLLNHPVITSFLWLKWIKTRRHYNLNLRFYAFFVFILTWFILYGLRKEQKISYTPTFHVFLYIISILMVFSTIYDTVAIFTSDKLQNEYKRRNKNNEVRMNCCSGVCKNKLELILNLISILVLVAVMVIYSSIEQQHLWWILFGMTIVLGIRELFQVFVYGRRYFYSWENLFEILVIILASLLLYDAIDIDAKRHLAAMAIVLSWIELIKLFGHSGQLPGHNR